MSATREMEHVQLYPPERSYRDDARRTDPLGRRSEKPASGARSQIPGREGRPPLVVLPLIASERPNDRSASEPAGNRQ
jgi:hypothetical protein